MKILVMTYGIGRGGIAVSLDSFLAFLISEGHDVWLCTWKEIAQNSNDIPPQVHILQNWKMPGFRVFFSKKWKKRPLDIAKYLWGRLRYLCGAPIWEATPKVTERFDIAIAYHQNESVTHFVIDKIKASKKIAYYHNGEYEKEGKEKLKDQAYYHKYNKIVAVSESCRQMLLASFPTLKDKIITIHNIIPYDDIRKKANIQIANEYEKNVDKVRIITVGRLSPEKGQLFALDVAIELRKRNVDFIWLFMGSGPMKKECLEKVEKYNLQECCLFTGVYPNPYPYMKQASVSVQPSQYEADPLVIHEALVLKTNVIATDIPPMNEVLNNGEYGIVCRRDAIEFANAIINVGKDNSPKLPCRDYEHYNRTIKEKIHIMLLE